MNICYNLNEVQKTAEELIKNSKTKTLLFYGEMGVGKTTLIKAIVEVLGSTDEVSSPTFSIVNEYVTTKNESIYHFDLYRIKDLEEAYNFGIEDYLDSDNWKLIEWPQTIEPILYNDFDKVTLNVDSENKRTLFLN